MDAAAKWKPCPGQAIEGELRARYLHTRVIRSCLRLGGVGWKGQKSIGPEFLDGMRVLIAGVLICLSMCADRLLITSILSSGKVQPLRWNSGLRMMYTATRTRSVSAYTDRSSG